MRDLEIWRLLHAAEPPDAEALSGALAALAAAPLESRWPFLAGVEAFARHADPRVRAAALRCFARCDGGVAEQILVAGLHDGDGNVREAAIEVLEALPEHLGPWLHAVVHPDLAVRAAAVARAPVRAAPIWSRLLADPEVAPAVAARLPDAPATVAVAVIPAVLQHLAAGHVAAPQTAAFFARLPWTAVGMTIVAAFGPPRASGAPAGVPTPVVSAIVGAAELASKSQDALDIAVDALVAAGPPHEVLHELLRRASANTLPFDQRLALSILARLHRDPDQPPVVVALAACVWPSVLGWTGLPVATRRAAAAMLVDRVRREGSGVAPHLLDLPGLFAAPLDLAVAVAVVQLGAPEAATALLAHAGQDALLEAASRAPAQAAALLASTAPEVAATLWSHLLAPRSPDVAGRVELVALALQRGAKLGEALAGWPPPQLLQLLGRLDALDALDARQDRIEAAAAVVRAACADVVALTRVLLLEGALEGPATRALLALVLAEVPPGRLAAQWPKPALERLADLDRRFELAPWAALLALAAELPGPLVRRLGWGPATADPADDLPPGGPPRSLSPSEVGRLRAATGSDLTRLLATFVTTPGEGLVPILLDRPPEPSATACAAALASADALEDVAAALDAWGERDPDLLAEADRLLVRAWSARNELPPAAALWLYRWERPLEVATLYAISGRGGLAGFLRGSLGWESPALRGRAWGAARRQLEAWRWRAKRRILELAAGGELAWELTRLLCDLPDPERGPRAFPVDEAERDAVHLEAATMLALLHDAGVDLSDFARRVEARTPWLSRATREALAPWIATGAAPERRVERVARATLGEDAEPERLAAAARGPDRGLADVACRRLVALGAADALTQALVHPADHLDLVSRALAEVDDGADRPVAPATPAATFHLHLARAEACRRLGRGREELLARALVALEAADVAAWFAVDELERLRAAFCDDLRLAGALATCPAEAAHRWAVSALISARSPLADEGLAAFLAEGTDRAPAVRLDAALALRDRGDVRGAHLIAAARLRSREEATDWCARLPPPLATRLARSATIAGVGCVAPAHVLGGLDKVWRDAPLCEGVASELLTGARDPKVQQLALEHLTSAMHRARAARRLAGLVSWGRAQSRKLLGRTYRIELLGGDALGYTRLDQRVIHVNPVAMLRGDQDGEDVARGLIVHELGHHLYNADAQGKAVWKRATEQGLDRLHNLVCDEHLERNLRTLDPVWGDHLKRLAAWAFQHARRELSLADLQGALGPHLVPVLRSSRIGPARRHDHVTIGVGRLLQGLEASGSSFGRFVRALRMGLGDRDGDPRVAAALALFGASFRERDNEGLWEVTLALRELFGSETDAMKVCDLHDTAGDDPGDGAILGRGVTSDQIEREADRLDGVPERPLPSPSPPRQGRSPRESVRDRANVGAAEDFARITNIVPLPYDPAAHRALAADVAGPARRLREVLERLGLRSVPIKPRLSGVRLDRSRLAALALRGEPRVLVARRTEVHSDLFVGVVVDCSGSMGGARMDRARRFAALLAEACRGLPGVDLRIFGFTDRIVYDAGDADRPAAHGLVAGGGNNDAAGLYHAAGVALRSRRKSRLLVMISDGAPTECTTTALRGLVKLLQRRHQMACAQVVVATISDPCFDTYLEVLDDDMPAAVRAFGRIVARLVSRTLSAAR